MAERKPVIVSPEEVLRQRGFMAEVSQLPQRPRSYHVVTYG